MILLLLLLYSVFYDISGDGCRVEWGWVLGRVGWVLGRVGWVLGRVGVDVR